VHVGERKLQITKYKLQTLEASSRLILNCQLPIVNYQLSMKPAAQYPIAPKPLLLNSFSHLLIFSASQLPSLPSFLSSQLPSFPLYRRHKMDNNVYNRVVEHVMSVTDEQFVDLSVAGLACSLQIDRFKLSRQFKSQSDMTLEEFLFKEKMARAAFLLKTFDDITVKEVSRRIGFCTCDYFIRKFKQHYGVAPGKYKEFKCRIPRAKTAGKYEERN
jgi:AraC-like DNA-binding protein